MSPAEHRYTFCPKFVLTRIYFEGLTLANKFMQTKALEYEE